MDGFKALVGAACFAVIGGVGWIGYGELKASQARAMADAKAWRAEFDRKRERAAESLAQCRSIVSAWDGGDKAPALAVYGSMTTEAMSACRSIIDVADLKASRAP